jgi:peroxiredoxin
MPTQLKVDLPAPDFSLTDVNGNIIQLENYQNKKTILLCLIRGFA